MSKRPMRGAARSRILADEVCEPSESRKGGELKLPNPLAIGVTLGGLLLDVIVPRPKPRAGFAREPYLLSPRTVSRHGKS